MRSSVQWVLLYAILIIGLSSIPGERVIGVKVLSWDKLLHAVEFMIFGILVTRAIVFRMADQVKIFLIALLIAGIFGALIEVYQILIPGRESSYVDWVADLVGAALGSLAYLRWKCYCDKEPAD